MSETERRVEVLAYRGAEERLGRLLLQLAAAPGGEESEVALHVSHEDLARMAAMSRAHVTVTMGRFRRRGIVRYKGNRQLRWTCRYYWLQ
ncbi:MAG: Crp/Fnr family transcriptional regulator [Gammaproteobacteria bacterium]|nr:Crp/Fnr family transcriptional regulator [Gammaproteobacteria bacterium]